MYNIAIISNPAQWLGSDYEMKFKVTLPDNSTIELEDKNPEYDFAPLVATVLLESKYGKCNLWGYSNDTRQSGYVEVDKKRYEWELI